MPPVINKKFKRQEPMVVSTEVVNGRGFRVLTSGLDLTAFAENPVMTYNHIRHTRYSDSPVVFPIGAWESMSVSGSSLRGVPVFNSDYDYGKQAEQMYEDGFLNAASIHIEIIATSEDPALMVPGQTRATVTQSRIREIAIVDIPENWTCHKLTYQGKTVELNAEGEDALDEILPLISKNKKSDEMDVVKLAAGVLGMKEDATEAQVIAKVTEVNNKAVSLAAEVEQLKKVKLALQAKIDEAESEGKETKLSALLDKAETDGKITKAQRPHFETMAAGDGGYEALEAVLGGMQAYKAPGDKVEDSAIPANGDNGLEALSARFVELDKKGQLGNLPEAERKTLQEAHLAYLKKQGKVK